MKKFAIVLLMLAIIVIYFISAPHISTSTSTSANAKLHKNGATPIASAVPSHSIVVNLRVDYRTIARQAAQAAGIDPTIFIRQINEESGFNPNALSPAGAEGIAQFMPTTAAGLHIDPWQPAPALYAAARLMHAYLVRYGGDYAKALACYNAGPSTLQYALDHGGQNWQTWLPQETRNYITIILQ